MDYFIEHDLSKMEVDCLSAEMGMSSLIIKRVFIMKSSERSDDAFISEQLAKGMETVEQLDKIIREKFKDNPEIIKEWEEASRIEPVNSKPLGTLKLKDNK
jgi:hypothetical protein